MTRGITTRIVLFLGAIWILVGKSGAELDPAILSGWNVTAGEGLNITWGGYDDDGNASVLVNLHLIGNDKNCPGDILSPEVSFSVYYIYIPWLCSNSKYNVIFELRNSNGTWEFETETWTLPDAPTNISVAERTNSTLLITWMAPPGDGKLQYKIKLNDYILDSSFNDTEYLISELKPYTWYKISVSTRNVAGWSDWSKDLVERTLAGTPGEPKNLKSQKATSNSVLLHWEEPDVTFGPVDFYVVYTTSTGSTLMKNTTTDTSFAVQNLHQCTLYAFEVTAVSESGEGPPSNTVTSETSGIPSVPRDVKVTNRTARSFTLQWSAPKRCASTTKTYDIYCSNIKSNSSFILYILFTHHEVSGLEPYSEYRCRLRAIAGNFVGKWTEEISVRTKSGIPSEPTDVASPYVTDTSLLLTWNEPRPNVGPVKEYSVEWKSSDFKDKATTKNRFLNITSLSPYTEYMISICASTAAGYGTCAKIVNRTDMGVPGAPVDLTVVSFAQTNIYVEWKASAVYVGPIEIYVVRFQGEFATTNATSLNITSLDPYTVYNISVRACNKRDCGLWSNSIRQRTKVGIPHMPNSLVPTRVKNTTAEISWKEPTTSTGPIKIYHIAWFAKGEKTKETGSSPVTKYEVSNLRPYTTYVFQVQAETEAGRGHWSEDLEITTQEGIPNSPTFLNADEVKNTTVTISWKEPNSTTGPITKYHVRLSHSNHSTEKEIPSNEMQYTFDGLQVYSEYSIQIQAETTAGKGNYSEILNVHTASGVPYFPTLLKPVKVRNTTVALFWEEPKPTTGPITKYVIHWNSSKNSYERELESNDTKYTLSGLQSYTNYSLKVLAVTAAGRGNWSETLNVRTASGIPYPPSHIVFELVTNSSIKLSWEEPSPFVGPVIQYSVYYANNYTSNEQKTRNTTCELRGLAPYTNYTIKIRAETENGFGKWSYNRTVLTGDGIPNPPSDLKTHHVGNTTITIKWNEPTPLTGAIVGYTLRWFRKEEESKDIQLGKVESFVLEKLKPFTTYFLKLRARTKAGDGEWTPEITVTTAAGLPNPPQDLLASHVTSSGIKLTWVEPTPLTGSILQYEVEWFAAEAENSSSEVSQTNTIDLTGLDPYTDYFARVRAKTEAGEGPWSNIIKAQTAVGIPFPASFKKVKVEGYRTALVSWMTHGPFPGPVRYSLQAWQEPDKCSPGTFKMAKELRAKMNASQWEERLQKNNVTELTPFGTYFFRIVLSTEAGDTNSQNSEQIQMPPEAPGPPTDVTSSCDSSPTTATVQWSPPKDRNGHIHMYEIEYETEGISAKRTLYIEFECTEQTITLHNLRPERTYQIYVRARVADVNDLGPPASPEEPCVLPAGIPLINNSNVTLFRTQESGPNGAVLLWSDDMFSDYMGALVRYTVLVGKLKSLGNSTSGLDIEDGPPWTNFTSGSSDFYQATPSDWNPLVKGHDPLECKMSLEVGEINRTILRCMIGIERDCREDSFCNGPLSPDTKYEMKIRGFTRGGYTETMPIYVRTGSLPKNGFVGAIAAVFILSLLVFTFVGGAYVAKRKGWIPPLRNAFEVRLSGPREITKPAPEVALEVQSCRTSRNINSENFADYIKQMMSDSSLMFSQEFERLRIESPQLPVTTAAIDENRTKNRFMNIFPFDHSRVKLLPLGDEPGSDFVNANYIPGYSSPREYIASQGPLPHTVDDFWRMVWEQSVTMIVMLTQCVERGKTKCEKYWPDSGEARFFGDLQVTTFSESNLSSYVIRVFRVQLGNRDRQVKQMHFTHWPDFGCPEKPEDLVNFTRAVRDHLPRIKPGPIVVHCSAGVGRTGTFITVDKLSQQLRHCDDIDIFGTVLDLRKHRTNMVQTEDQYVYIHLCVKHLLKERERYESEDQEEDIYSNVGKLKDTGV